MKRHVWIFLLTTLFTAGCGMVENQRKNQSEPVHLRVVESGSEPGFKRVLDSQDFRLPEDHGPHFEYQSEWWYYTGNLTGEKGERFSYQLTIFRRGLSPQSRFRESNFAADQVYFAHFAMASLEEQDHRFYERFSRGALGLANAKGQPFEVFLEDWRITALDTDGSRVRLIAQEQDLALDLELQASKVIVVHGDGGVSAKSSEAGNASYYLSYTRMTTVGSIRFDENTYQVEGTSWFDHEWSTSALSEGVVGWDWFSLQLDDQQELMLYVLRQEDGTVEPVSAGTLVRSDGSLRNLELDDFSIEVLDLWESPESGAVYPSGWVILIPDEGIQLELTPAFEEQEMRVSFTYWEGSVEIEGSIRGLPIIGRGFVELTGYLESMEGVF